MLGAIFAKKIHFNNFDKFLDLKNALGSPDIQGSQNILVTQKYSVDTVDNVNDVGNVGNVDSVDNVDNADNVENVETFDNVETVDIDDNFNNFVPYITGYIASYN